MIPYLIIFLFILHLLLIRYVPASSLCNTITISMDLNKSFSRFWKIRVGWLPLRLPSSSFPWLVVT